MYSQHRPTHYAEPWHTTRVRSLKGLHYYCHRLTANRQDSEVQSCPTARPYADRMVAVLVAVGVALAALTAAAATATASQLRQRSQHAADGTEVGSSKKRLKPQLQFICLN